MKTFYETRWGVRVCVLKNGQLGKLHVCLLLEVFFVPLSVFALFRYWSMNDDDILFDSLV
jgi:hypothetical protein